MILYYLICFKVHLTGQNISEIIGNGKTKPVFLLLWANWCPHCASLKPHWNELANETKYQDQVIFADMECESNRKECNSFEGENYPRIYWIDNQNNSTSLYLGERSHLHLSQYIEKQLKFPLIPVDSNTISEYIDNSNTITSFLFTIPENDIARLELSKKIASEYRNIESHFLLTTGKEYSLDAYVGNEKIKRYTQQFDDNKSLRHFIISNSVPFMCKLSGHIMTYCEYHDIPTFIFMYNISSVPSSNSQTLATDVSAKYIPTIGNCVDDAYICRYTGVDVNTTKLEYIIFDPKHKYFWVFNNDDMSDQKVLEWIDKVFNHQIRGSGPGTGFFSNMLEEYYITRGEGENVYQKLLFFGGIGLLTIVVTIFQVYFGLKEVKNKELKKDKNEEKNIKTE